MEEELSPQSSIRELGREDFRQLLLLKKIILSILVFPSLENQKPFLGVCLEGLPKNKKQSSPQHSGLEGEEKKDREESKLLCAEALQT